MEEFQVTKKELSNVIRKSAEDFAEFQRIDELLSIKETMKLLKITRPTLHSWTKKGVLQSYMIGSKVLYKLSEIMNALTSIKHS